MFPVALKADSQASPVALSRRKGVFIGIRRRRRRVARRESIRHGLVHHFVFFWTGLHSSISRFSGSLGSSVECACISFFLLLTMPPTSSRRQNPQAISLSE